LRGNIEGKGRIRKVVRLVKRITASTLMIILVLTFVLPVAANPLEQNKVASTNVSSIEVEGNKEIPTDLILGVVKTKAGDKLSNEQLSKDLNAISELGYFMEIEARFVQQINGMKVIFVVVENPKVSEIAISGNTLIPTKEIYNLMKVKTGEVFNIKDFDKDLNSIVNYYYEKGYWVVISDLGFEASHGQIKIVLSEQKVGDIKLQGNDKTQAHVLLREIQTKSGEPFNAASIYQDQRRIALLGLFEEVSVEPERRANEDLVDLTYKVKERKSGAASFGAGYSSVDGFIGYIDVSEQNLLGRAQKVYLRWEFGGKKNSYELGFMDPWFTGKKLLFDADIYNRTSERGSGDKKYTLLQRGGTLALGKWFGDYYQATVRGKIEDSAETPLEGSTHESVPLASTRSLTFSLARDTRDSAYNATKGSLARLSTEVAGQFLGGAYSFNKVDFNLSKYIETTKDQVLAMRLGTGAAFEAGSQVPRKDKFYVGGADTLRGYNYGAFIGDKMLVFNTEYRVKFASNLQGVAFVDVGRAWDNGETMKFEDLKAGAGLGIRIETPLGLMRIDYGISKEQGGRAYFSLGQAF
jgi:outer membrane protein insertion porin family